MLAAIEKDLKTIANHIKFILPNGEVYLFGSYAYGTPHKNSDLDIFIVCPDKSIRKIDLMYEVQKAIYRDVDTPVDVMVDYNDEFDNRKQNKVTLEYKIANEGVIISGN